jgi:hypothetical protein
LRSKAQIMPLMPPPTMQTSQLRSSGANAVFWEDEAFAPDAGALPISMTMALVVTDMGRRDEDIGSVWTLSISNRALDEGHVAR